MEIPNFCRNSSMLMIVLYGQVLAVVVYLLSDSTPNMTSFGIYTLYIQSVSLLVFTSLCLVRTRLNRVASPLKDIICILIVMAAFTVVELLRLWAMGADSLWEVDVVRFVRLACVALLFAAILVRFLYLFDTLEQRSKAESGSRIQALQSRIKPHFLFNSLNTISELAVSEPQEAEQAVDALSVLFRANLETDSKFHNIGSEMALCEKYLSLEKWRLGAGLSVNWQVQVDNPTEWEVPKLIFQPLVENSILHGVQVDGSVDIMIDIRETANHLSLMIRNVKGEIRDLNKGHGIAIENIRERLFVLYDDQWSFRVRDQDDYYQVIMRIPKRRWHKV